MDNVQLIFDRAPQCFDELDNPDAVFVGGKGSMKEIVTQAYSRLSPGGRMVINAVTLDNVIEARLAIESLGLQPELSMIQISRGVPLAGKSISSMNR